MSTARTCAISLALLAGVSLAAQEPTQQDVSRAVVLPDSTMPHVLTRCSRGGPAGVSGFWRPSPADVAAAEDAVDRALAHALDSVIARDSVSYTEWRKRPRADWPKEYYRQYAGLKHRDGRRTIYVNGFAVGWLSELSERVSQSENRDSDPFANPDWWRFSAVTVCNGGEFFFGAVYDPSSKRVLSFQFNSRARVGAS